MRILAIDTTGIVASAAVVEDGRTIAEFTTNYKKNHSITIMPMIKNVLEISDMSVSDADYIACASGPGSFTGLRIGAATAKGLAFGVNKLIIPVPTLDSMAYNIFKCSDIIVPIMDAKRNQAYTAFYSWEGIEMKRLSEYGALSIDEITERLKEYGRKAVFLGDGVAVYKNDIEKSGIDFCISPPHLSAQRAAAVGALAIDLAKSGAALPPEDFVPFYLRKSQAEREYDEKNSNKETL